ncbi:hypothetical protein PENSPDRAFT_736899 [Peniophora sp. CONT]|nr:hypothetical protein PENSPDRAFT_736899 [Peniophora sp. CONT]
MPPRKALQNAGGAPAAPVRRSSRHKNEQPGPSDEPAPKTAKTKATRVPKVRAGNPTKTHSATEEFLPGFEHDTRTVDAFIKQRYVQLNVEHILGVGTAQDRSDLHRQLTKDIMDLGAALLLWKKSATASASVSCLPPEVLQNIFFYLALLEPPITPLCERERSGYDSDEERDSTYMELNEPESFNAFPTWHREDTGSLGWFKVSHVCSSWRSHILPMRSLWAGALGILPQATKELLKRAGSRPLSLALRESSRRALDLHEVLSHVMHSRICSIYANFTEETDCKSSFRGFMQYIEKQTTPWASLESVDISGNGIPEDYFENPDTAPLRAPALRNAKMYNCVIPFFASTLQRLSIVYDVRRLGYNALPLARLLTFIDGCQNTLQELELLRCISVDPDDRPEPDIYVRFTALRRLDVGSHSADLFTLVEDHIGYPTNCDIAFHALSFDADELHDDGDAVEPYAAFRSVFRMFADEFRRQHVPYGLVLDNHSGLAPFVTVGELAHAPSGDDELIVKRHGGARNLHFYPSYTENIFYTLRNTFDDDDDDDNNNNNYLSVISDIRALSIIDSDRHDPTSAYSTATVFANMPKLLMLQLRGYDQKILKGICDVHATNLGYGIEPAVLVLPELAVIRLSAGAKPLSCAELVELIEMRTEGVKEVKETKPLLRLIVDKDVTLADPENESEALERLKRVVNELCWKV